MKKNKYALTFVLLLSTHVFAGINDIKDNGWDISFDEASHTLSYTQNGTKIVSGAYIEVHTGKGETLISKNYTNVTLDKIQVNDIFGKGVKYTYTYSGLEGKEELQHNIYIYENKSYLLTEAAIIANGATTSANYIAPIVSTTVTSFLPSNGQNVIYGMPHDNDNWVGYNAHPWSQSVTSCEVSAAYDVTSRLGLVVGSIEHDNWKSGITITPKGQNKMYKFTVAAGVVSAATNDVNIEHAERPSIYTHGTISGSSVRSPKYFMGLFQDWRSGLEELGDATATLEPKLPWNDGTIWAWQSWGGMAEKVNYEGVINVSDFFKQQLYPKGFHNENGVCYMVLDSFWDNLSEESLKQFVTHCKSNGQRPGIYTTPFSYWGSESDATTTRPYEGSTYTWADMIIRAGGKMRKIASLALDPTHPATIEWNRRRFDMFKRLGFEYVKLDFLNNGTLEADKYYEQNITTGMQAYNYGMNKVLEMAKGMFVDLSIAPVFPAKGHARRISCDSWGELDNSMYTLNSMELGWWLDRVYQYNDPDHLVLSKAKTDGEARIRYTCGAMTGTVLLGDNYSLAGSYQGKQEERNLALRIATNKDVNDVARIGRSFRPVEGGLAIPFSRYQYSYGVDRDFVLDTKDALYYVVFNYDKNSDYTTTVNFKRIGIDGIDVGSIKELWTGESLNYTAEGFDIKIAACDVAMYRIIKKGASITTDDSSKQNDIKISCLGKTIDVCSSSSLASLSLYSLSGTLMDKKKLSGDINRASLTAIDHGWFIIKAHLKSNVTATKKIAIK